ncbi:ftsH [Symbiodinium sp. CCMP2592]|nr:ftsH [Symbiodinium sp. CCMP2592]
MYHIQCPHDRSSFASLVHILASLDLHGALEPLRSHGIRSAENLENTPKAQLRSWIGDPAIDKLFNRSVARPRTRSDAPVVHPYQRGSRVVAAAVQGETALEQADKAFQEDKFARSSRGPRESRWKLWCSLAEQRGLPPLPITVDLIDKIGALFKQARYRSAAQYYSVAKSEHRAQGYEWSPSLDHAVAQAVRSITRGMGPSAAKLDFPLESCSRSLELDIERAYVSLQVPTGSRIEAPADTGIVAAWFLLRGLEISSVVCEDVSFSKEGLVKLSLPVSKNDAAARGCSRTHACICSRQHDPGCNKSGDEALLFTPLQQCSCSLGRHPLCPYHAALRCAIRLRKAGRWEPKAPFFGDGEGPPTKAQVVWLARVFAWVLCEGDLRDWPRQVVQRWAQHAFRVAGAQLFARADLDLHVIMLIGRWGSAAICRYVQEAALANPARAAQAVADRTSVLPSSSQTPRSSRLALLPAALDQVRAAFDTVQSVFLKRVRFQHWSHPGISPTKIQAHPPPRLEVAKAMVAPVPFQTLCDQAAVHPTVRLLFKAKGVDVPGVLHHLFADRDKVAAFLDPLRAGIEIDGTTRRRSAEELLIDQATILELLDVIAASKAAAAPASAPTPAATTASAGSSEKSQELPAGYWNDFVTDYESTVVDGRNRRFPAHLLLGAEKTLGRMVAEKKSGLFTALPLGEMSTKLFAAEDGTLAKVTRGIPEPQRMVTMIDAFEACKFAFMFARWGPNAEVSDYFDFWEDLTRDNASRFRPDTPVLEEGVVGNGHGSALREDVLTGRGGGDQPAGQTRRDEQASMSHVTPPLPPVQHASQPQASQPHVAPPGTGPQPLATPVPPQSQQPRFPVAVLSFFDGIATALHAIKSWAIRPVLSWSWELDPDAIKVASSQHPEMIHHGDVFGRKPHDVLAALSASVPKDTVVLVFAAPPCHDFSRIRSDPPGTHGHEGSKVLFLVENVHMSASQQRELDDALGCRAFACDAASWGVVSRPRLWWSNVVNPPPENVREPPVILGGQARWRRLNRHWEILPNSTLFPRQVAQSCPFASFSEEVSSGRIRFPCLTTPAEGTQGREPPGKKRRSESPGTMERWKSANRSYPPWQFRTHALVQVAGKKDLPDPATREWLQLLPSGYTASVSPQARARLLGNAWHAGVARLLVLLVLCQAGVVDAHPVRAEEWYATVPDPCFQVRWHPDGSRPLQRVASWWLRSALSWDPNETQPSDLRSPGAGAKAHVRWAQQLTYAHVFPAPLNPCLAWTFQVQSRLGLKVVQVRESVLQDLQALVAELREDQVEALQSLPAHVAAVYRQGSPQLRFQLLPLAWLLELCQFPGRSELLTELFWGFRLLGPVVRGSGWLNRDDAKYARPLSKQDFLVANRQLAKTLGEPSAQPEHHEVMIAELEKEQQLGRVQGPLPLSLLGEKQEPASVQVARGFAVVQNDKVRRADDWLRSMHNSTISAVDTPPYLGGPTVVGGVLQCSETFDEPVLLGAIDHEGAYRSLPVREPTECGLVMPGASPSLWVHNALPFGSVGSVWAYLRVADVVSFLTISLLLMFAAHYVDDFFSLERFRTAISGFAVFQAFHRVLGFRMKEEKSKEPRFAQTLLGIEWTLTAEAIFASPGARRVAKLVETIADFLASGRMSASECSQLTGKLCFTCTWVFNHVGRMLLQPLYHRQHNGPPGSSPLTPRLQQALHQLRDLLPRLQPRRFAIAPQECRRPVAHLYADAFLTIHGVRRVANKWLPALSFVPQSLERRECLRRHLQRRS